MPHLSVIIPAYNEAKRLPATLSSLKKYLERQSYQWEVIVVDDGSTDHTVKTVEAAMETFPGLRLVKSPSNQGKGSAVRRGMAAAEGQFRLFMDADNSTEISEVEKLLPAAEKEGFPVVIGSRYLQLSKITVKQPLKRRLIARMSNWLIQRLVLPGVRDTQCGFKLFSAPAAERIFPLQRSSGWSFDFEILTIARHLGYAIKEVPVEWADAENSTLRAGRAMFGSLLDLLMLKWRILRNIYS